MLGMLGNPKKVASIIIASGSRKDDEGNNYKELEGVDKSTDDFDMIAEEMATCIENKDKSGLASCLKSLLYSLESKLSKGESEEVEEESEEL